MGLSRYWLILIRGKTVKYVDADKVAQTGIVEHVDVSAKNPTLTVAGRAGVLPASLTSVS